LNFLSARNPPQATHHGDTDPLAATPIPKKAFILNLATGYHETIAKYELILVVDEKPPFAVCEVSGFQAPPEKVWIGLEI
jgi:hypothetical protein